MYQSANKQATIQRIIQGLAITYSRRRASEENSMGKRSIRSALEKKEAIISPILMSKCFRGGTSEKSWS